MTSKNEYILLLLFRVRPRFGPKSGWPKWGSRGSARWAWALGKNFCLINESGPSQQVGSGYEKTKPVAIPTFVHDLVEELLIHQYIIFKRNRYSSVRLIERGSERVFLFLFLFLLEEVKS